MTNRGLDSATSAPRPVESGPSVKVIILGGGKGGTALLELLTRSAGVEVTGIADINPDAPGLRLARRLCVPTSSCAADLIARDGADLVVDVTGDPSLPSQLSAVLPSHMEWLGGTAARLVWLLIQQQHDLRAQLIHADKLATIGTFAAQIAHDLKNPLYCIREFARFIEEEQDPEQIKEYSQEIQKADRYLASILDVLTGYTRRLENEEQTVSLADLLDQALTFSRYASPCTDLEVVRQYGSVPSYRAQGSELLQIFVNLLTNAIQAMEGRGRLTIGLATVLDDVEISIQDTGPGIRPEHRAQLFTPFFTTKPLGTGTGLGLSIVRTLVAKYGGTIDVESELGHGATFRIRLPVALARIDSEGRQAERTSSALHGPAA